MRGSALLMALFLLVNNHRLTRLLVPPLPLFPFTLLLPPAVLGRLRGFLRAGALGPLVSYLMPEPPDAFSGAQLFADSEWLQAREPRIPMLLIICLAGTKLPCPTIESQFQNRYTRKKSPASYTRGPCPARQVPTRSTAPLGSQSDTKAQLRHGRVLCAAFFFIADNPCACITQPRTKSCTPVASISLDHIVRHACGNTTRGTMLYAIPIHRRSPFFLLGTIFQQHEDMGQS